MFRLKRIEVLCENITAFSNEGAEVTGSDILVPVEFQQRMRRRKFGRKFKLIADLALLLGTGSDTQTEACSGVEVALSELKTTSDLIWNAYGFDTKAACVLA